MMTRIITITDQRHQRWRRPKTLGSAMSSSVMLTPPISLSLIPLLEQYIAEMDLSPFGLPADWALGQLGLTGAHRDVVDLHRDGAVRVAGDLGRIPFAHRLNGLFVCVGIELLLDRLDFDEEEFPVIEVAPCGSTACGHNAWGA